MQILINFNEPHSLTANINNILTDWHVRAWRYAHCEWQLMVPAPKYKQSIRVSWVMSLTKYGHGHICSMTLPRYSHVTLLWLVVSVPTASVKEAIIYGSGRNTTTIHNVWLPLSKQKGIWTNKQNLAFWVTGKVWSEHRFRAWAHP